MYLKIIGAALIIVSSSGIGFRAAASYRYEEKTLRQLVSILSDIECELQYRQAPLPQLCHTIADKQCNILGKLFNCFSQELENQIFPNPMLCMQSAIEKTKQLPKITRQQLEELGAQLGSYDLSGQLQAIELIKSNSTRILGQLCDGKEMRLRNYQTLGLCAGAALSILFI